MAFLKNPLDFSRVLGGFSTVFHGFSRVFDGFPGGLGWLSGCFFFFFFFWGFVERSGTENIGLPSQRGDRRFIEAKMSGVLV